MFIIDSAFSVVPVSETDEAGVNWNVTYKLLFSEVSIAIATTIAILLKFIALYEELKPIVSTIIMKKIIIFLILFLILDTFFLFSYICKNKNCKT